MVPVGGMIVRVDGLEERRGGREIDVDAALFMSILGWRCCLCVCRLSGNRVVPVKKA